MVLIPYFFFIVECFELKHAICLIWLLCGILWFRLNENATHSPAIKSIHNRLFHICVFFFLFQFIVSISNAFNAILIEVLPLVRAASLYWIQRHCFDSQLAKWIMQKHRIQFTYAIFASVTNKQRTFEDNKWFSMRTNAEVIIIFVNAMKMRDAVTEGSKQKKNCKKNN